VNTVPVLDRALPPAARTISTPDPSPNLRGRYNSITIGADGLGLISYFDATYGDLMVAHCEDVVCSETTVSLLDYTWAGFETSIAIGSDGLGLISYRGQDSTGTGSHLKVAHCDNLACTSATVSTLDATESSGYSPSITIGTDGLGLISYLGCVEIGEGDHCIRGGLKVAHCSDLACSSASLASVDTVRGAGTAITIGADGLPLIGYWGSYARPNYDLQIARCSNLKCTAAALHTVASVESRVNKSVDSMVLGIDGLARLTFAYDSYLHIAQCNDVACTAASLTLIGDGIQSSVTVDSYGLPLISYFDRVSDRIRVAHCTTRDCQEVTIVTLDSYNALWWHTSATIGADGLPLISYHLDNGMADGSRFRVVHCSNPFCVPYFRRR
jgi:hypothetical protein